MLFPDNKIGKPEQRPLTGRAGAAYRIKFSRKSNATTPILGKNIICRHYFIHISMIIFQIHVCLFPLAAAGCPRPDAPILRRSGIPAAEFRSPEIRLPDRGVDQRAA